ncbi:MAG: GNAT family N-acetyltransferase, partial [Clostridiales bacterium]|nr:GNAT family N-acetyltransferase [Clostridiales bacterium]
NVSANGFKYKLSSMRSGIYYVYKEAKKDIEGIIAGFNDGNVMMYAVNETAKKSVLGILTTFPFHSVWGLDGTLPSNDVLSESANFKLDKRKLEVMVLPTNAYQELNVEINDDMEFSRIDKRILFPSIITFIKICLWEGFGFKSNAYDIRKRIKERTDLEPYWFLSDNGVYVAQAHIQAMTKSHGYIGGVCTPRDSRGQGYAKQIMKIACNYIIQQGRIPSLAVSSTNVAAYNLYKSMGFQGIGETLVYMKEREFKGDENET